MYLLKPKYLAHIHTVLIVMAIVSFLTKYYIPDNDPMYGDFFFPFFYISGPIVFFLSYMIARVIFPYLLINSVFAIVIVPGFFCICLGYIQYYYILRLLFGLCRRKNSGPIS